MSKYEPLGRHLSNLKLGRWRATFAEIENILGFRLPKSARHYPAWWANQAAGNHVPCQSWLAVGWCTEELDLSNETILFVKQLSEARLRPLWANRSSETNASSMHPWDRSREIAWRLGMNWKPIGKVTLGSSLSLVFPQVDSVAAIYRLRIRRRQSESLYVGETDNLRRRFTNYRSPGPSQRTSLRINDILKSELAHGAQVSISAIFSDAWIDRGNGREGANLDSKVVRCLFENLAILDCSGVDIEVLNKAHK